MYIINELKEVLNRGNEFMKRCKICRKKPRLERRVNCEGIVFCSDDCYELFENSPNDNDHPYIDDYDAVRSVYTIWMKRYENDLYDPLHDGTSKKEDLIERIGSVLEEFDDYYRLEGSDGLFSEEIYTYSPALEGLQLLIENWQPEEKELKRYKLFR